ncbi:MAG TPA: lipase family protein [Iamia sp.]|nr:lipase family protein [Iamia sp.]
MARTPCSRIAAALVALIALGAGCGGGSDEAAADPHGGHGGGAVDPLRPIAGEPVALGPDEDLYAGPDPLPAGDHGTLLRYQEVDPAPMAGARAYRILYLGQTLTGEPTAVSGTVLVPDGAPAAERAVIGLAPAATGLADECAPSRTMGGDLARVGPHLAAGHVVAATDLEGLGTPGRHPHLIGPSAGRSVLDAVRAAQQVPGVGVATHVGLTGRAEGGHAALWADRLAATWAPELPLVGTLARAPATDLGAVVERPEDGPALLLLVAGLAASSRYVRPADLLSDAGLAALDRAATTCLDALRADLATVAPADLLRPAGASPAWVAAAAGNDPGAEAGADPVLLVGEGDGVDRLAARLCTAGQDVEVRPSGEDEDAAAWFTARIEGEAVAAGAC